ncbi:hypothetical protein NLJ89_g8571 [Agrocybe chaxingu]|uniref:Chromatin modification-related protein n=1 Tax=Agrocybe chaxingu TaxID=84603 RepID=A0A9W8K277_9AGAR|nr:hypothetical protein NLJ89_g8571 [Agrocybe chaxingu]
MSLVAPLVPNYEEAANVASEFITSIDNLPNEVQHLLQEIKIKDQRCQELLQDTARDQSKYVKSSLKSSWASSASVAASNGQNRSASPTPTSTAAHPKAHLPARITAAYAEIDALNNDKIALAQRIINLLSLTRARLDADLTKVRLYQGESIEDVRTSSLSTAPQVALSLPHTGKRADVLNALNPVVQINESLRNATGAPQSENSIAIPAAPGPAYNKKRRITTNTSIKLPSPAPATVAHQSSSSHSRSRLSRQATIRVQQREEEDLDADAEGEEDYEGEDAEEDLTLYCFCHKQSYGDMIGCDNSDCPYQWFHISCVGVKQPLPDKWYCPECIKKSVGSERRKGRKK